MSRIHWLAIPAVLASLVLTVQSDKASAQEVSATAASSSNVSVEVRGMSESTLTIRRDKAEILTLARDAASVIVGNPDLVSINVETPRRLVIIPVDEGMTTLTVLDRDGEIITERPLVVRSNSDAGFVRVRRICPDSAGCEDRDVYYCEEGAGCANVASEPTSVSSAQATAAESSSDSASDDDYEDDDDADGDE